LFLVRHSPKQVVTNNEANLKQLAAPNFDPENTVLLSENLREAPGGSPTNRVPGVVNFESYAPKKIVLRAQNSSPAVLLLNDRFDPNWKATVDGARRLSCAAISSCAGFASMRESTLSNSHSNPQSARCM
jgi:hypothetical protein